jgi:hypothetical protein
MLLRPDRLQLSSRELSAEAAAVVQLIRAAQEALSFHCVDDLYGDLLTRCINRVSTNFGLRAIESLPIASHPSSLAAVFRLLVYTQSEVVETLTDAECARLLQQCINDLAERHFPFYEQELTELYTSH